MVSAICQHESPIVIYMRPPPLKPFSHFPSCPSPLGCHRPLALGSVCRTPNSYWLSTLHMAMNMFQCYSLKSSHLLSPLLCPKVCSLCLHVCCWQVHQYNLSRFHVYAFSSVSQSCPTLCKPMDFSTACFSVFPQLPELAQTHVHRVGDAIQPFHLLSSSPPAFSLSQHQGLFQ